MFYSRSSSKDVGEQVEWTIPDEKKGGGRWEKGIIRHPKRGNWLFLDRLSCFTRHFVLFHKTFWAGWRAFYAGTPFYFVPACIVSSLRDLFRTAVLCKDSVLLRPCLYCVVPMGLYDTIPLLHFPHSPTPSVPSIHSFSSISPPLYSLLLLHLSIPLPPSFPLFPLSERV